MKQLKEKILEEILNKSDVRIKEDFYISYKDMKQILNDNLVESSQIINEKNLQEDFIEGLESLLEIELEVEEIENLAHSGILEECTDRMFETESEVIGEYYRTNFKDHYKNQILEMHKNQVLEMHKKQEAQEEYQCSKCNRFFTEEDIFRFDSPYICNVCAQD